MSESFIHPTALCEAAFLGAGTQVGAFVQIMAGARIGTDGEIENHVCISRDVTLGNRVTVRGGVYLPSGMVIEDDVCIGQNACFADSRLGQRSQDQSVILRKGCVIGANATLCAGISIGEEAVVDAGAVVTQSVQPFAIVAGNPAKVIGFANTPEAHVEAAAKPVNQPQTLDSKVAGVRAYHLPFISDPRGNLTVGEFERSLPFIPKRYFLTFDVPNSHLRGEHAHKECHQFLICVHGSCAVVVDDGTQREEFLLDRPTFGVHVPPMIWATEYKHSADSTLLVFASHYYDPEDYIRDYHAFLAACQKVD